MKTAILIPRDSFWHAKNVTVKNSVIKGEYLAWYSDGLTLENCKNYRDPAVLLLPESES